MINLLSIIISAALFYLILVAGNLSRSKGLLLMIFQVERMKEKGEAEYFAARFSMSAYFLIVMTILINTMLRADLIGFLLGLLIGVLFPVIYRIIFPMTKKVLLQEERREGRRGAFSKD